jgi:hypothetical protein
MDLIWIGLILLIIVFCFGNKKEGFSPVEQDSYQGNPYDYYYPQYLLGYNLRSYFYRPLTTNHNCYIPAHLDRQCYRSMIEHGVKKADAQHKCMQPAGITLDCLHKYYY